MADEYFGWGPEDAIIPEALRPYVEQEAPRQRVLRPRDVQRRATAPIEVAGPDIMTQEQIRNSGMSPGRVAFQTRALRDAAINPSSERLNRPIELDLVEVVQTPDEVRYDIVDERGQRRRDESGEPIRGYNPDRVDVRAAEGLTRYPMEGDAEGVMREALPMDVTGEDTELPIWEREYPLDNEGAPVRQARAELESGRRRLGQTLAREARAFRTANPSHWAAPMRNVSYPVEWFGELLDAGSDPEGFLGQIGRAVTRSGPTPGSSGAISPSGFAGSAVDTAATPLEWLDADTGDVGDWARQQRRDTRLRGDMVTEMLGEEAALAPLMLGEAALMRRAPALAARPQRTATAFDALTGGIAGHASGDRALGENPTARGWGAAAALGLGGWGLRSAFGARNAPVAAEPPRPSATQADGITYSPEPGSERGTFGAIGSRWGDTPGMEGRDAAESLLGHELRFAPQQDFGRWGPDDLARPSAPAPSGSVQRYERPWEEEFLFDRGALARDRARQFPEAAQHARQAQRRILEQADAIQRLSPAEQAERDAIEQAWLSRQPGAEPVERPIWDIPESPSILETFPEGTPQEVLDDYLLRGRVDPRDVDAWRANAGLPRVERSPLVEDPRELMRYGVPGAQNEAITAAGAPARTQRLATTGDGAATRPNRQPAPTPEDSMVEVPGLGVFPRGALEPPPPAPATPPATWLDAPGRPPGSTTLNEGLPGNIAPPAGARGAAPEPPIPSVDELRAPGQRRDIKRGANRLGAGWEDMSDQRRGNVVARRMEHEDLNRPMTLDTLAEVAGNPSPPYPRPGSQTLGGLVDAHAEALSAAEARGLRNPRRPANRQVQRYIDEYEGGVYRPWADENYRDFSKNMYERDPESRRVLDPRARRPTRMEQGRPSGRYRPDDPRSLLDDEQGAFDLGGIAQGINRGARRVAAWSPTEAAQRRWQGVRDAFAVPPGTPPSAFGRMAESDIMDKAAKQGGYRIAGAPAAAIAGALAAGAAGGSPISGALIGGLGVGAAMRAAPKVLRGLDTMVSSGRYANIPGIRQMRDLMRSGGQGPVRGVIAFHTAMQEDPAFRAAYRQAEEESSGVPQVSEMPIQWQNAPADEEVTIDWQMPEQ